METPNRLYKYRSQVCRDLELVESNCFWASSIEGLNDPCEAYSRNYIHEEVGWFSRLFQTSPSATEDFQSVIREACSDSIARAGVLSLSSSPLDELLWAHYGDSHKGFCVEYDTSKLLDNFSYDGRRVYEVQYSDWPPSLHLVHIIKSGPADEFVVRLLCNKSARWKYENEYRILSERKGRVSHHHEAVTGIYFGVRMNEKDKAMISNRLSGRGIQFKEVFRVPNTYQFSSRPYENRDSLVMNSGNFSLQEFGMTIQSCMKRIEFKRVEVDVLSAGGHSEEIIRQAHAEIVRTVFSTANRHVIRFQTSQSLELGIPWAIADNQGGSLDIRYNR